MSHRLILESLHRLIKGGNLCRQSFVLTPQSLDTREFAFNRLLARAELLTRLLKEAQGFVDVVFAGR